MGSHADGDDVSSTVDGRRVIWVQMLVDVEADAALLVLAPGRDDSQVVNACNFECSDLAGDVTIDVSSSGQILGIELRGIRGLLKL